MLSEKDKLCLQCTLPICDQDRKLPCRYLETSKHEKEVEKLRKQKRESESRRRALRREEAVAINQMFRKMLTDYGTYGRHRELMKIVKGAYRGMTI